MGGGCSAKVAELQVQGFKKLVGKECDDALDYIKDSIVIKDKKKFSESSSIFESEDKDFNGLVFCAIVTESLINDQQSKYKPYFTKILGSKFYLIAFVGDDPIPVTAYDVKCDENNKKLVVITFKNKTVIAQATKKLKSYLDRVMAYLSSTKK